MVFVSHETYTPARGGSAAAEVNALRRVFGPDADRIVIANTKGFTGHAMGAGIEDVVAVKALETGWVPPVANFKEIDPELGPLNLSKGGVYPIEYALRLGAGFGSQISMTLLRRVKTKDGVRPGPDALGYAYRIVDEGVWHDWLRRSTGYEAADLEVVNRTLRVRDQGAAARVVEASQYSVPVPVPASTRQPPVPVPVSATKPTPSTPGVKLTRPSMEFQVAPVAPARELSKPKVETQVAQPAPWPTPPTLARPAAPADPVKERILNLVAEKTGYPVDMLDLDLDLEADLGVDTVKQAEVFAAVREIYAITRDEQLKLRDFPTLSHVIRFVYDKRPDLVTAAAAAVAARGAASSLRIPDHGPNGSARARASWAPRGDWVRECRQRFGERTHPGFGFRKDGLSQGYVGSRPGP